MQMLVRFFLFCTLFININCTKLVPKIAPSTLNGTNECVIAEPACKVGAYFNSSFISPEQQHYRTKFAELLNDSLPKELYTKKIVQKFTYSMAAPTALIKLVNSNNKEQCWQKCFLTKFNNPKVPAAIKNWGSAGGGNGVLSVENGEVSRYFSTIFKEIAKQTAATDNAVKLNPTDLFHGHLITDSVNSNLLILFHAKEYPNSGGESFKFQQAKKLFSLELISEFKYTDPHFKYRNYLWSMKNNAIYSVGFTNYYPKQEKDYLFDLFAPLDTSIVSTGVLNAEELSMFFSTVQDEKMAKMLGLENSKPLGSLNWFNLYATEDGKYSLGDGYLFFQ